MNVLVHMKAFGLTPPFPSAALSPTAGLRGTPSSACCVQSHTPAATAPPARFSSSAAVT